MSKKNKKNKGKNRNKSPINFNGIDLDSVGELEFIWYLEELKELGYISKYERCDSYLLSDSLINNYVVNLKTKSKPNHEVILMGHSYTPDVKVYWTDLGGSIFCSKFGTKIIKPFICNHENVSFIELKPDFDYGNLSRLATINIKWIWQKYGIYIQMIKNKALFGKTFTPKKMLKTKTGKERKLNFNVRSIEEYIKSQGYEYTT